MTYESPPPRYSLAHYVWEEDLGPGRRPLVGPGSAIVETTHRLEAARMIAADLPGRMHLRELRSLKPIGDHATHVVRRAVLRQTERRPARKPSAQPSPAILDDQASRRPTVR